MKLTEQENYDVPLIHQMLIEKSNPVKEFFHQWILFECIDFSDFIPDIFDSSLDIAISTFLDTEFEDVFHNL